MHSSCAMMASSVTPSLKEAGAEVDGIEGARGVAVSVRSHFGQSWASLHQTDFALMELITVKIGESGIEIEIEK